MKISHSMDLAQLAALMGPDATPDDAAVMRDALIGAGYIDTDQVARSDWRALLDLVVTASVTPPGSPDARGRTRVGVEDQRLRCVPLHATGTARHVRTHRCLEAHVATQQRARSDFRDGWVRCQPRPKGVHEGVQRFSDPRLRLILGRERLDRPFDDERHAIAALKGMIFGSFRKL
jgi:hypothetical protein